MVLVSSQVAYDFAQLKNEENMQYKLPHQIQMYLESLKHTLPVLLAVRVTKWSKGYHLNESKKICLLDCVTSCSSACEQFFVQ